MQRTKKIPSRPDFYFATKRAYEFLIELEITSLPVDPFNIVKRFEDSWHLLSWSELKLSTREDDPLNIKRDNAEAKTIIIRGTNEYLIVYDDTINSPERIRWTIAHEIGHIVLGHLVNYEATALNRRGLTKSQYGVLETEAHWFAEGILAPNFLISLFAINTIEEISFLCDISKKAGTKVLKHIQKNNFKNDSVLEKTLLRNFYNFFLKDDFKQSIMNGINKFYRSSLYVDFLKFCRICGNCNNFICDINQSFCNVCGQELPQASLYYPLKKEENGLSGKFPSYLEGKYYESIFTYEKNRVVFCPKCKNHNFSENAEYCSICGTPLHNRCLREDKILDGTKRYCPDCGSNSLFNELNLFHIKSIEPIDSIEYLTMDISDYIEYEYWNYIRDALFIFENNADAYSALQDTVAFVDYNNFAIVSNNPMSIDTIKKYDKLIILALKKYGLIDISSLVTFYEN